MKFFSICKQHVQTIQFNTMFSGIASINDALRDDLKMKIQLVQYASIYQSMQLYEFI